MVRSPLQNSSPRDKKKKVENSHKACMCTLTCGHSLPIYRYLVCIFFIKIFIIISIYDNIIEYTQTHIKTVSNSPIFKINHELDSIKENKGLIHRGLRYFLRSL